ncbi:ABC transporter permease [Thermasporomyces composti]|uniref:Osmoprotectant transport system permease protein n=1 Tax=Thermasporomyces composti TaxID=696763 RepID=A0A3D9V906_THECX|nr:osmoprotectant transport system permease protein [Thermasporomyces composti]
MIEWLSRNVDEIVVLFGWHAMLSVLPLVFGLLLSIPLGWLARERRWLYPPLVGVSSLLYTIPSLALFVALPAVLGTRILDPVNVVVALTIYTVALLVRTVADGLAAVPDDVRQAATAMGFQPLRRLLQVELPVAVPVIGAGLRVAAVSNVSLVSVAAIIGVPELGMLFTDGFQRDFFTPLVTGIGLCVVLALLLDGAVLAMTRALTPWERVGSRS